MLASKFGAILQTLNEQKVDFIVVGGVSAVLQGAPVTTFDLDVVHSRERGNVGRLLIALDSLDAHYRSRPALRLRPDASHLSSPGQQLLMTCYGPLDLLGSIGESHDYEDLLKDTTEVVTGQSTRVRVLTLERLIDIKLETHDEKDLAMLPVLRRTLEQRNRE